MKITAIIAAYNEEDRIAETIEAVKALTDINDILVVDDGSDDDTVKVAKSTGVEVLCLPVNQGKGAALKKAIEKINCDFVVFLDGDLGNYACQIQKLIDKVVAGDYDMAIANFPKPKTKGGIGLAKGFSRWAIKHFTSNIMEEPLSGQRVIRSDVLKGISIAPGFGVETAMTIDVIRNGYKVIEVPVEMSHRETGRNFAGFLHRGVQFKDILKVVIKRTISSEFGVQGSEKKLQKND